MSAQTTQLQLLRRERHPLVALTALAFFLRLGLVILATALSPQAAAEMGLTSLCQPTGQLESTARLHDPLSCQCGPACAHGCATGSCLAGFTPVFALKKDARGSFAVSVVQDDRNLFFGRHLPIRGPPESLT